MKKSIQRHELRHFSVVCFLAAALLPAVIDRATAAELRLRAQCSPAGPVVTLGDVAEICSTDARQAAALAAVEMFPAPPAPEQRVVRLREIQDLLLLRGMNLAEHQFSGASEVTIQTVTARPQTPSARPVAAAAVQRIKRRLSEALLKYLGEQSGNSQGWSIDFALTEAQARSFADPVLPLHVAGGCAPWTGSQKFDVSIDNPKGPMHASIDVEVHTIAPVVVAIRPLARGAVIGEGDVSLQQIAAAEKTAGTLHSINEAIGHEMIRAVAVGSPVSADSLRAPLAVRRGDVVTVYAQAGGIRIRTNARARDEGSVGELVAVESLLDRATYFTRVSGIREVEVYARPPRVEAEAYNPANTSSVVHR
jgi:flagellar basal body P-ring formation protein FlgA